MTHYQKRVMDLVALSVTVAVSHHSQHHCLFIEHQHSKHQHF